MTPFTGLGGSPMVTYVGPFETATEVAIIIEAIADLAPDALVASGIRWRDVAFGLEKKGLSGLEGAIVGGPGANLLSWRGARFLWEGIILLGELEEAALEGDRLVGGLPAELRTILLILGRAPGFQYGSCGGVVKTSGVACKGGANLVDGVNNTCSRHLPQGVVRTLLEVLRSFPVFPAAPIVYAGGTSPDGTALCCSLCSRVRSLAEVAEEGGGFGPPVPPLGAFSHSPVWLGSEDDDLEMAA